MNSQQHSKAIRRYASARGIDPLAALRAAPAARRLRDTLAGNDVVVWSPDAGSEAWKALPVAETRGKDDPVPSRILAVLPEGGSSSPAAFRDLAKRLSSLNVELKTVVLNEIEAPSGNPVSSPESDGNRAGKGGPFVRLLRMMLEKTESRHGNDTPPDPDPGEPRDGSVGYPLLDARDITPADRLAQVKEFPEFSEPGIYCPPAKIPPGERFLLAGCAAAAGMYPLIPLKPGESARAAALTDMLNTTDRGYSLLCAPEVTVIPGRFPDMEILSPASPGDLSGAVAWAKNGSRRTLIADPGDNAHPERNALKKSWDQGTHVIVRESEKGGAGKVLLVAAGQDVSGAAKTADRLVRDNIAVTVVSLRLPCDTEASIPAGLLQGGDMVVVAGTSPVANVLKSTIVRIGLAEGAGEILIQDGNDDAVSLADSISARLREMRLRRTVDDVRADRWR